VQKVINHDFCTNCSFCPLLDCRKGARKIIVGGTQVIINSNLAEPAGAIATSSVTPATLSHHLHGSRQAGTPGQ
jgi:hypothetical protein